MSTHPVGASLARALLRDRDVAELCSISVRLVWKLSQTRNLPEPIRLGRCTRWRESDIRRWLESQHSEANEGKGPDQVDEHGAQRSEEPAP